MSEGSAGLHLPKKCLRYPHALTINPPAALPQVVGSGVEDKCISFTLTPAKGGRGAGASSSFTPSRVLLAQVWIGSGSVSRFRPSQGAVRVI